MKWLLIDQLVPLKYKLKNQGSNGYSWPVTIQSTLEEKTSFKSEYGVVDLSNVLYKPLDIIDCIYMKSSAELKKFLQKHNAE